MATGAIQTMAPYPNLPEKALRVSGHNLSGYSEPIPTQGVSGTVIPHAGPAGSFAGQKPAAEPLSVGVMTIQDATKENPFGGIKMLTPLISNVTAEDRQEAIRQAYTMTDDPIKAGMLMFELLAKRHDPAAAAEPALPQEQPMVTMPLPQTPVPAPPPAAAPNPEQWAAMMAQMASMMGMTPPAPPAPLPAYQPPMFHPQMAPPQPPPAVPQQAPAPVAQVGPNLGELLGIPELDFQPLKPSAKVVFGLGSFGNMTAYYHWVLIEANAMYLVLDNRWEGSTYAPEKLGQKHPIKVTLANTKDGQKTYTCYSVGLSFIFGIFSVTILLKEENQNG